MPKRHAGWDTIVERSTEDDRILWMAVVPVADLKTHTPDDNHCACSPLVTMEPVAEGRLVPYYIHAAHDGRELVERHGVN